MFRFAMRIRPTSPESPYVTFVVAIFDFVLVGFMKDNYVVGALYMVMNALALPVLMETLH